MANLHSVNVSSKDETFNMVRILAKQKKGLHVCHINAQSLNNKIHELRLTFENSGVDIICISETWLNESTLDGIIMLNGYNLYRGDRVRHGGGVAIYVKNNLRSKFIVKSSPNDLVEHIFVEVTTSNSKVLIGSVYRPNRNICFNNFFNMLEMLTVSYTDIIVAGDFNSNIIVESSLLDNMSYIGLLPTNTSEPTHFTHTSSSLLDIFFVSNKSKVLLYDQIIAPGFSKHDLIFISYEFGVDKADQKYSYRNFKNLDYHLLEERLLQVHWDSIYDYTSVDDKLLFLQENIISLYNIAIPVKTRIILASSRPWFSADIKQAMQNRDVAYTRWKRFRMPDLYDEYRALRKVVNAKIRIAKIEYYSRRFNSALGSKLTWKTVRDIGIGKAQTNSSNSVDVDELNKTFLNLPTISNSDNFHDLYSGVPSKFNLDSCFEFACVNDQDIVNAFSQVKSNAMGHDGMDPRFVRLLLLFLLPYLKHLFNCILTTGIFPKDWKHSKIIPLPKSKTEYRPISILCFLSKVFEKILHRQITQFINNNELLYERQSGFRPGHSCLTALTEVSENIRQELDDGNIAFLVLLDYSKAFDSVVHQILMWKLKHNFNFSTSSVRLLSSYLTERTQSVSFNNKLSSMLSVSRGVPQGSVLGPLLFSLYANDLPQQLSSCRVHLYADDVQLLLSCPLNSFKVFVDKLNVDLAKIYQWATANGLCLNPRKSKCLIVQKRNHVPVNECNIILNNERIEVVSHAKNLGIYFNNKLTWSNHINVIVGQTYFKLRSLWQTQSFTPLKIRIMLAKSYIMPGLLFGCELFGNCDSNSKRKLNVAFNNIIRYVYGLKKFHSVAQYATLLYGISLEKLMNIKSLVFLHKIIYSKQPTYLFGKIKFNRSPRGKNIIPFVHKSLVSDWQFFVHAVRLWNSLPSEIQILSIANKFKKNVFRAI